MTETIEQARQILEERLTELEAEADRLREAIAKLAGDERDATRPRRRRAAKASGSRAPAPRAKRGERQRQHLESILRNPDYRVAEHADAVGVRPQQLYPLLHKLESSGKIAKTDDGYRAVDNGSVAVKDQAG